MKRSRDIQSFFIKKSKESELELLSPTTSSEKVQSSQQPMDSSSDDNEEEVSELNGTKCDLAVSAAPPAHYARLQFLTLLTECVFPEQLHDVAM